MNRFENIPQELKSLRQWVNIYEDSKIPMQPRYDAEAPASSSNPFTWGEFEVAEDLVHRQTYANLGFVFHDNGYVGIDIDVGYDEDGLISPLAADILGVCHSYTERSRSGRGFHVILKGELPFKGKNNKKGVEIYKDSRYFITTGDVLLYRKIEENQTAIDYVVETYFPEAIREGEGRGNVNRVYSPLWELPKDGRVKLRPVYPRIPNGCRNICLTSLAGMLHNQGYDQQQIYDELTYANLVACDPSLGEDELETIVRSVTRYKR